MAVTGGVPSGEAGDLLAVAASGLLDVVWYLQANPDVARAGLDPLIHFMDQGWREGRDPGPLFSVAHYLREYPDIRLAGINPLAHYLRYGWREGRWPHPDFDPIAYVESRAGMPGLDICPLVHIAARSALGDPLSGKAAADLDLERARAQGRPGVLVVSRDLQYGAQTLALEITECLRAQLGRDVRLLVFGGGSPQPSSETASPITELLDMEPDSREAEAVARRVADEGYETAIVEGCAAGGGASALK